MSTVGLADIPSCAAHDVIAPRANTDLRHAPYLCRQASVQVEKAKTSSGAAVVACSGSAGVRAERTQHPLREIAVRQMESLQKIWSFS
jgi:hypothetical protein